MNHKYSTCSVECWLAVQMRTKIPPSSYDWHVELLQLPRWLNAGVNIVRKFQVFHKYFRIVRKSSLNLHNGSLVKHPTIWKRNNLIDTAWVYINKNQNLVSEKTKRPLCYENVAVGVSITQQRAYILTPFSRPANWINRDTVIRVALSPASIDPDPRCS